MDANTGKLGKPIAASDELEDEPTVSPDGKKIAYERGPAGAKTQIYVTDLANAQFPTKKVTNPGFRDHRPAFSPNGKVIAFIRDFTATDHRLCFIPADATGDVPRCLQGGSLSVDRPAWSPDGHAIVVRSGDPNNKQQAELGLFVSPKANSVDANDWTASGLITDKMHSADKPGESVNFAAFSPDGKQLAFSANFKTGGYHLFIAPVGEGYKVDPAKARAFIRVNACEVSWWPSGLLALGQRDLQTCSQAGQIVRADAKDPENSKPLTKIGSGAENPVWSVKPSSG
jgi:Tol biopolymer transport system component